MTTTIKAPAGSSFTGQSYVGSHVLDFKDGVATITDTLPEGVRSYLTGNGYEVDGEGPTVARTVFDPSEHTVKDVVAYLDGADSPERARVLAAEKTGEARKGVLEHGGTA